MYRIYGAQTPSKTPVFLIKTGGSFHALISFQNRITIDEQTFPTIDNIEEHLIYFYTKEYMHVPYFIITFTTILGFLLAPQNGENLTIDELENKLGVNGIPKLILIDGDTGDVICTDAREQIQNHDKQGKNFPWKDEKSEKKQSCVLM
ncbi:unnamed protein product [Adineta steineri]|uniref:Thioredoxin-like protein n=1 Tax=Adineta steineri TaxID=433720 RepID=A0A813MRM5_9BILA|nr:unnamed protein product [Adineta steineri]